MLKDRSGRSFDALGRTAGISGSSLHRYCAGTSVPPDSDTVVAIARVCGATRDEVKALNRLWVLAAEHRNPARATAEPESRTAPDAAPAAGSDPASRTAPDPADPSGGAPVTHGDPANGTAVNDRSDRAARLRPIRSGRRRATLAAAAVALILLSVAVWFHRATDGATPATVDADNRMLFSAACQPVVSMGQTDQCVREVQNLLARSGGRLTTDGIFGPQTLRQVTAFQVLAGLTPVGVVNDETKIALYEQRVPMATWSSARVARRIQEVFAEAPRQAVAIADCQSFLDPHYVLPNTNGTRNWGLFQLSDTRLRELGGTPRQALDPEWNIQAAHRMWGAHRDFRDWPACARAASRMASPCATPTTTGPAPRAGGPATSPGSGR